MSSTLSLDEHTAGTTARVEDPPYIWLDHLCDCLDYTLWGVELTLTLFHRELREEVLINSADQVLPFVLGGVDTDDLTHKCGELGDIQIQPQLVVVGKDTLRRWIVLLHDVQRGVREHVHEQAHGHGRGRHRRG